MLNELNQTAAVVLCDVIDSAIRELENAAKIILANVTEDVRPYFTNQKKDNIAAINQLKKLRAEIHKRAFEAYLEENSTR